MWQNRQCANFATHSCVTLLEHLGDSELLTANIVFCVEATFRLFANWNRLQVRICGINNLHAVVDTARYTPKFGVFCAVSKQKMFWPLIFADRTLHYVVYLHILEEFVIPISEEAVLYVLLKQGGAPAVSHIAAGDFFDWYSLEAALVT